MTKEEFLDFMINKSGWTQLGAEYFENKTSGSRSTIGIQGKWIKHDFMFSVGGCGGAMLLEHATKDNVLNSSNYYNINSHSRWSEDETFEQSYRKWWNTRQEYLASNEYNSCLEGNNQRQHKIAEEQRQQEAEVARQLEERKKLQEEERIKRVISIFQANCTHMKEKGAELRKIDEETFEAYYVLNGVYYYLYEDCEPEEVTYNTADDEEIACEIFEALGARLIHSRYTTYDDYYAYEEGGDVYKYNGKFYVVGSSYYAQFEEVTMPIKVAYETEEDFSDEGLTKEELAQWMQDEGFDDKTVAYLKEFSTDMAISMPTEFNNPNDGGNSYRVYATIKETSSQITGDINGGCYKMNVSKEYQKKYGNVYFYLGEGGDCWPYSAPYTYPVTEREYCDETWGFDTEEEIKLIVNALLDEKHPRRKDQHFSIPKLIQKYFKPIDHIFITNEDGISLEELDDYCFYKTEAGFICISKDNQVYGFKKDIKDLVDGL